MAEWKIYYENIAANRKGANDPVSHGIRASGKLTLYSLQHFHDVWSPLIRIHFFSFSQLNSIQSSAICWYFRKINKTERSDHNKPLWCELFFFLKIFFSIELLGGDLIWSYLNKFREKHEMLLEGCLYEIRLKLGLWCSKYKINEIILLYRSPHFIMFWCFILILEFSIGPVMKCQIPLSVWYN